MSHTLSIHPIPAKKPAAGRVVSRGAAAHAPYAANNFTMAFQPIVDVEMRSVYAYEALLRGLEHQPAGELLGTLDRRQLYAFDHSCQKKAIEMAADLGMGQSGASIAINLMPGALTPGGTDMRETLEAAQLAGLPMRQIIFELTEDERVSDRVHLTSMFREYREHGLRLAIDDFGAGYAGLALLAEFQPDLVKVDRALIHEIDRNKAARSIVGAIVDVCRGMGILVVAEGVERAREATVLTDLGVRYMQGYLFARPAFEALVEPAYAAMTA